MGQTEPEESLSLLLKHDEVDDGDQEEQCQPRNLLSKCNPTFVLTGLLLIISAALLCASLVVYHQAKSISRTEQIATAEGLNDMAYDYHPVRFDGGVFVPSSFKGPPSADVDAAWMSYIPNNVIRITEEEAMRAGGTNASVQYPEELGGGYMAYLELPHYVHCLYELWKHTWPSHYNSIQRGSEDPSSTFRKHLDHCADLLRIKLLCDADPTVITYNWVKHLSRATPNFNTEHQCRDADSLWRWFDENKVELPKEGLKKPADAIELDTFP